MLGCTGGKNSPNSPLAREKKCSIIEFNLIEGDAFAVIGTILSNRYRLLRDLGSGGMAKVYLAEDINENRLVAVKVLHPQFGEDLAYLQRFKREAKLASMLDSPHIVKILDYGSSRDTHFLVMEYVQGKNLREKLDEQGALIWQDALHITDNVCAALENAHRHNVVHRDIKPQNIMLADDGQIKVLDFGIARARLLPSLTQSGFVGSPYYIAPEQAMGEEVDIRSDLYSTGIVLYELLTGHVPFDSKSPWSIVSKHIVSEFPALDLAAADIPPAIDLLLKKLVAKRPEDRFQTPTAARKTIAEILTGHTLSTDFVTPPKDTPTTIETLFERATDAMAAENWQQAVNLLSQVLSLNPKHPTAAEKLEIAGTQARLNALYQAAVRAMENARWQEAVDELTEIIETEENFKDSLSLLERAKHALTHPDAELPAADTPNADDSLPQQPPSAPKKTPFRPPLPWIAGTLAVVLLIALAVFAVSGNNTAAAHTPTPSPGELLAQAQTAFENGDSATALLLVDRALNIAPDNDTAKNLKAEITETEANRQQLSQAIDAIAAKQWSDAIDLLTALHDKTDFQPDTVSSLLCDAYFNRGQERLSHTTSPGDIATVQSAQVDFENGSLICPDRDDLKKAVSRAEQYVSAQKNASTPDDMIAALTPIVKNNPAYARGQAAVALYNAYLQRGINAQTAGNLQSALEDFTAALNLNIEDTSVAAEKQAAVLKLLAQQPPTPTVRPATATASPADAPIATTQSPGMKYAAPKLLSPEPEAVFSGQYDKIVLQWQPVGNLAPDEFYDVTIRYFVGDEPRYWGSGLIKDTSWQVPVEAGYGHAGKDEFWWWVTVRKGGTAQNGKPDLALSPSSEERIFYWRPK